MTKAMMQARNALAAMDRYEQARAALGEEYRNRFDNVHVNDFGEYDADEILEINAWHVQEENRLKKALREEVKAAVG